MSYLCQYCDDLDDASEFLPCDPLKVNACGACQKLLVLQQKINETRLLLNDLKEERRQLKEQANRHHDKLNHRLPPEVASTVFTFCIPEDSMDIDLSNRSGIPQYTISAPLILSAVCRRWRGIAQSTPQLWQTIPIVCHADYPEHACIRDTVISQNL
ncbi:hypothetical protein BDN70DRAFT_38840 [Pholiota conissans]|uniref:F-box domain-containing protein n=1 Tax=Pholiota conissans TaxID=109636 RepID=A0A9P5Z359_9AGAR|nr:hypothetical protein BDN70DRAFT_38840 [Pholiota conissans]